MAILGKIYVIFDGVANSKAYDELKKFKQADGEKFDFYDGIEYLKELDKTNDDELKAKIQENMNQADCVLVLLSKNVKSMRRFIKWQIEYAVNQEKVLFSMNCNRIRSIDYDVTPTILKNKLSLYLPFDASALELGLMNWPKSFKEHLKQGEVKPYRYDKSVYEQLFNVEEE